MQKKYQPFKIIPNNINYVFSLLGNGRTFKITKELDNELIEKSIKHKKEIKLSKGKIPREWLYGLWLNIYIDSDYEFYPDAVGLNIYETKFQQWRKKWSRKLLYYFSS
jgi:hypothetical protein